jgi:predicted RNase H-like HicB family nuclease
MAAQYTALIQRDGPWWIGWIQEISGVNSQGVTREELLDNLHSALREAIQMNRQEARASAAADHEEVSIEA